MWARTGPGLRTMWRRRPGWRTRRSLLADIYWVGNKNYAIYIITLIPLYFTNKLAMSAHSHSLPLCPHSLYVHFQGPNAFPEAEWTPVAIFMPIWKSLYKNMKEMKKMNSFTVGEYEWSRAFWGWVGKWLF